MLKLFLIVVYIDVKFLLVYVDQEMKNNSDLENFQTQVFFIWITSCTFF